ncbi:MAG: hypothetical protein ABSA82_06770 [Thermacetogeniaceae bacterium]|jgi:hypothetical protein
MTFPGKDIACNLSSEVAPDGAEQHIESRGITGRLFNEYTWGGYQIYKEIPVFIDGRDDAYLARLQPAKVEERHKKSAPRPGHNEDTIEA